MLQIMINERHYILLQHVEVWKLLNFYWKINRCSLSDRFGNTPKQEAEREGREKIF